MFHKIYYVAQLTGTRTDGQEVMIQKNVQHCIAKKYLFAVFSQH